MCGKELLIDTIHTQSHMYSLCFRCLVIFTGQQLLQVLWRRPTLAKESKSEGGIAKNPLQADGASGLKKIKNDSGIPYIFNKIIMGVGTIDNGFAVQGRIQGGGWGSRGALDPPQAYLALHAHNFAYKLCCFANHKILNACNYLVAFYGVTFIRWVLQVWSMY